MLTTVAALSSLGLSLLLSPQFPVTGEVAVSAEVRRSVEIALMPSKDIQPDDPPRDLARELLAVLDRKALRPLLEGMVRSHRHARPGKPLDHHHFFVAKGAMRGLAALRETTSAPLLGDVLLDTEAHHSMRQTAGLALQALGTPEAAEYVIRALSACPADFVFRMALAENAVALGVPSALGPLRGCLATESSAVGRCRLTRAIERLEAKANGDEKALALANAKAKTLCQEPGQPLVPKLRSFTLSGSPPVEP